MKTATQRVRIHRDGADVWLDLGEWLRTCAPYDLHPIRPMGGLCRHFQVGSVDAVEPMLSETEALQLCSDGFALLYQNPNGIELWTPFGIPVRWDVNLSALRVLEPAVDTTPMAWDCGLCAFREAPSESGLPAVCDVCGTAWFADGTPKRPTPMQVTYMNYKGVTRLRWIIPKRTFFGTSPWHPEPQWFLEAFDVGKVELRTFALNHLGGTGNFLRVMEAASESILHHTRRDDGLSDFDRAVRALKSIGKRPCHCGNKDRPEGGALDPKPCGPCIAEFVLARLNLHPVRETAYVEDQHAEPRT